MEPDSIARGLRRIRIERGWQQRDVAALLGVHTATISRIETGVRRVRRVREVAEQLGVTIGYLTRDCPQCGYQPPAGYQCLRCGTPSQLTRPEVRQP
jgi:transcriptional regulator with XRE-family HTH domain